LPPLSKIGAAIHVVTQSYCCGWKIGASAVFKLKKEIMG
jgi:hypothetical protein